MKKLIQIGVLALLLTFPTPVKAAELVDDELGLRFEYSDTLKVVDNQQLLPGFRLFDQVSQDIRFEVMYRKESLSEALQDVQLRMINTASRSNLEFLGSSAIELVGTTFDTSEPMKMVLVPHQQGSLQIASFGNTLTAYQAFLRGINKPRVFSDISNTALREEIEQSFDAGVFAGYERGDGTREFRPNEVITRAAFMKVMVLSAEGVTQEKVENEYARRMVGAIYSDVEDEAWFAPYIYFASDQGWVSGYADQSFRPADPINAAEASKIILKSKGVKMPGDDEVWYRPFFSYWANSNILVGNDDLFRFSFDTSPFRTYEPVTRAQVAGLLMRLTTLQKFGLSVYGIEKGMEGLDFSFGSAVDRILDLGKPSRAIGADQLYSLWMEDVRLGNLIVYGKSAWIERETNNDPLLKGLKYFGENTQEVYAFRSLCGSDSCADKVLQNFMILSQDLFVLGDGNLSFSVLSRDELTSSVRIDDQLETLTVQDLQGQELVLMSFFPNRGRDAEQYNDQLPLRRVTMGGKVWNVYEGDRVTLTTALGPDLVVYTLRTIRGFDELSDEVRLMMRTLRRN